MSTRPAPPPAASYETFAEALTAIRESYGYSRAKLAMLVGQSKGTISLWEEGERYPKGRDLPRLRGSMPAIGPYLHLVRRSASATGDFLVEVPVPEPESEPALAPADPAEPEPATFGAYLRRERERANLGQRELATLLNIAQKTVSRWELGGSVQPDHLKRILDLVPAMARAPAAPAPLRIYTDLAGTEDYVRERIRLETEPTEDYVRERIRSEQEGQQEIEARLPTPEPEPALAADAVTQAAQRYAAALVAAQAAQARTRELQNQLADALAEDRKAKGEIEDAHAALLAAAKGGRP